MLLRLRQVCFPSESSGCYSLQDASLLLSPPCGLLLLALYPAKACGNPLIVARGQNPVRFRRLRNLRPPLSVYLSKSPSINTGQVYNPSAKSSQRAVASQDASVYDIAAGPSALPLPRRETEGHSVEEVNMPCA